MTDTLPPITAMDMKRFSAQYHREAIDAHQRAAEHHKSMARNHKAQLKAISKEIYAAKVSLPIPVADFKQRIAIMMRERETGKKYSVVGASRIPEWCRKAA